MTMTITKELKSLIESQQSERKTNYEIQVPKDLEIIIQELTRAVKTGWTAICLLSNETWETVKVNSPYNDKKLTITVRDLKDWVEKNGFHFQTDHDISPAYGRDNLRIDTYRITISW